MEVTNTLEFQNRLYNELSGGEKQRVILARALASSRRFFFWMSPPPRWISTIRRRSWS